MAKIFADKYYTPPTIARWCIEKTYEIIGKENITEVIEPSAGCGMFSLQIPGCKAYDLYPQSEYIEQADFTELKLDYKKGRLFIGNPPYGGLSQKLIKQFYEKSVKYGDYVAFLLPANYHNNYTKFYKFEIVYSELIKTKYTNVELNTAFVIYKRNDDKDDWREKYDLEDISYIEYKRSHKNKMQSIKSFDYCFITYGNILKECKPYDKVKTLAIVCNNPDNKEQIIKCLKWLYHYNKETKLFNKLCISADVISWYQIVRYLKICIPSLK
jgi:hypothetical protein